MNHQRAFVQFSTLLSFLLFSYIPVVTAQTCIFEDDFEDGTLDSTYWTAHPSLEGENGVVEVVINTGYNSDYAVSLGRLSDGVENTTNALDLHLDLSGQDQLTLEFWINDIADENHTADGIYFSDNNGASFTKVFDFRPEEWCNFYGRFPPLDVDHLAAVNGLVLNRDFVIRFQQQDNSDFSTAPFGTTQSDGFYIDEVKVCIPPTTFAQLPFNDDFETGAWKDAWAWSHADATEFPLTGTTSTMGIIEVGLGVGMGNSYGVRMGARCDRTFFGTNALDLHLDLSGENQVALDFWINDLRDENHTQDGLYFSDNGGVSFVKVLDFRPEEWCSLYGRFPPIDVDYLASINGLSLTDRFIIRFQQHDNGDFSTAPNGTTETDGYYIDEVKVYDPETIYASLPFFDDFEAGAWKNTWTWSHADATALPLTGTTSTMGIVQVDLGIGLNESYGVRMGARCDRTFFGTNALDLHLDLSGENQVALDFWINDLRDENHTQDGLYFSDNGGVSFVKVLDFRPEEWCSLYGRFPPIDVDHLASTNGLSLTDRFIIRFQQHDNGDFSTAPNGTTETDGYYIDEVKVYDPETIYASLPFIDDFEAGAWKNAWTWSHADATALPLTGTTSTMGIVQVDLGIGLNESYGVKMGARCDRTFFGTNALDLHLNTQGITTASLRFYLRDLGDETHTQDGIYMSTDAGNSFKRVFQFDPESQPNTYSQYIFDLNSLASGADLVLGDSTIIRFQQHDNADFSTRPNGTTETDGFYLDSIQVTDIVTSTNNYQRNHNVKIYPNPANDHLVVNIGDRNAPFPEFFLTDIQGKTVLTGKLSSQNQIVAISEIPNGIYFLSIVFADYILLEKIIKAGR